MGCGTGGGEFATAIKKFCGFIDGFGSSVTTKIFRISHIHTPNLIVPDLWPI